jgi:DNA repair exonuclease SbcCD ATPase subunit
MAQRRVQLEAQGTALTSETEALAQRLAELEHRNGRDRNPRREAEGAISASLQALADRLGASRNALAGTDATIAALTDSSVRLLELIQASVKHSNEELPAALASGEARLSDFETRMAALREAASETDARGSNLADTIGRADENLRRTYADLGLAPGWRWTRANAAHGATLADLRQELDGIAMRSANLAEESRTQLGSALAELSRSTEEALAKFGESGAAAVSELARQLGSESGAAIEQAMRASAAETSGKLEQAAPTPRAVSREAAIQLRDQLAKVNELAAISKAVSRMPASGPRSRSTAISRAASR